MSPTHLIDAPAYLSITLPQPGVEEPVSSSSSLIDCAVVPAMNALTRRGRSNSTAGRTDVKSNLPMPASSSRDSVLPAPKSNFLRRSDAPPLPPPSQKGALLSLSLSSPSFLDSSISDIASTQPLYRIKTTGTTTTVMRRDPVKTAVAASSIKWPKMIPLKRGKEYSDGVLILMKDGRWSGGQTLLKQGKDNTRKFTIPNYSHSMKWKQQGSRYFCTTPTVRGPIAMLEPRKGDVPPKLTVYETLHDKYDPKALSAFKGVSILLLDYLVVTALLLVTDLQEWMLVRKFEGKPLQIPHPSEPIGQGPASSPGVPGASDPQWRKVMFGEPIYPKIASDAKSTGSGRHLSITPTTPNMPRTPSFNGRSHSPYVQSDDSSAVSRSLKLSPKLTMRSFIDTDMDASYDSGTDDLPYVLPSINPPSPSAESLSSAAGPSHSYIDPSFYRPPSPLPEPALPSRPISFARSLGRSFLSQPSTPTSATFNNERNLPLPPLPMSLRRARSVSPTSPTFDNDDGGALSDVLQRYLMPVSPLVEDPPPRWTTRQRSDSNVSVSSSPASRSGSIGVRARPLPLPPPVPQVHDSFVLSQEVRRAQSTSRIATSSTSTPPRPQRSLPPTPQEHRILPTSPRSQVSFSDIGPMPATPESYGEPLYQYTSHNPNTLYPSDEVYSRQPPITKASHEDLAQWLHELTADDQVRTRTPEPLPRSSIFDVPPPAYSSISFSTRPEGVPRPPVPVPLAKIMTGSDASGSTGSSR